MTVYFCRSCVISKQQANYSGCIPREKALNCFAHSLPPLNYTSQGTVWLVREEGAPAWGLSSRRLCPNRECGSHSVLAHRLGGHQPRSAAASGAGQTPVISGCSVQAGGKLFPFPGLNFSAVLPETDDDGVFLVRSDGSPGVPIPCAGRAGKAAVE